MVRKLYYTFEGIHIDQDKITRPVFTCTSLRQAVKEWQQQHTIKTAEIEVRQDTNSGYRVCGTLSISL